MQTMHTVLKRGALVWDRDLVPPASFSPRLARLQAAIAAAGHDAWLIYGDALRYGDLAYLTHFLPRVRGALLLVPRAGEPTLLVAVGSRDIPAAKTLTWVEDVRPFTRLPGEVAKLVRERGLERARIGLVSVEEGLAITDWEQVQTLLPEVHWEPADAAVLRDLRASKDATELAALRHVAGLVCEGLAAAAEALRPGARERAVLAAVDRCLRYRAVEDARLLIASGPRASTGLRPPDDRRLAVGDVVLLHLAAEYQRYWAEAGQTFVLGAPDAATRALAEAAERAVAALADRARPGVTAGALADAALAALDPRAAMLSTSYGLGHGIGLDLEEPPYLRPGAPDTLVAGAVLALHVVLHGADGRGALATRLVVVGPDGVEPLLAPPALQPLGG